MSAIDARLILQVSELSYKRSVRWTSGSLGNGIRGQALVGSICAGLAAYVAVRFLMRFFETQNLMPFAIYCLVFGGISIIRFA